MNNNPLLPIILDWEKFIDIYFNSSHVAVANAIACDRKRLYSIYRDNRIIVNSDMIKLLNQFGLDVRICRIRHIN